MEQGTETAPEREAAKEMEAETALAPEKAAMEVETEREVEQGRLTKEEAESDSRRNVLLQSIGAGGRPVPAFIRGTVRKGGVYLLCSDGFRHEISKEELMQAFCPSAMAREADLKMACVRMTELDKARGETDNISVIAVKAV